MAAKTVAPPGEADFISILDGGDRGESSLGVNITLLRSVEVVSHCELYTLDNVPAVDATMRQRYGMILFGCVTQLICCCLHLEIGSDC